MDLRGLRLHTGNTRVQTMEMGGMSEPKIPKLEWPNDVTIRTDEIRRYLKNNSQLSDHFQIGWNKDSMILSMENDVDISKLMILREELIQWNLSRKKDTSLFSYDYFDSVLKQVKDDRLKIYWGQDHPIKLEWNVGIAGNVQTLIAPRIEDD